MSISLQYWKQSIPARLALWCMVVGVVFFGIYGAMLVQSYQAYAAYQTSAQAVERLIDKQLIMDQAVRVAGVKKHIEILQEAVAQDPGRAEIHFELGELLSAAAEDADLRGFLQLSGVESADMLRKRALACYARALERFPTNSVYQQRFGLLYDALGFPAQARMAFARAETLDPRNASLQLFLVQYYWAKHDSKAFDSQVEKMAELYDKGLKGGGPATAVKTRVDHFFQSIDKEELLKL